MESFMNLPDTEKVKCFEVFLHSLSPNNSDNSGNSSSKRLSLDSFWSNLTNGQITPSEGNARKKQKTLDDWLKKGKDLSTEKDKTGESSCALEESASDRLSTGVHKNLSTEKDKTGESSCALEESASDRLSTGVHKDFSTEKDKTGESSCALKESASDSLSTGVHKDLSTEKDKTGESSSALEESASDRLSTGVHKDSTDKDKTGESSCALEESSSDRLSCVQSTPDNTNSVSIYENEYSTESAKHLVSKSNKVNNNFVKNVQISASKKNESSCIVTEKYNLRSKRRHANPSRPRCPCECSIKTDNIRFHKSNKVQTHSEITNICNVSSENVLNVLDIDRNQSNNKDCQEVDNSPLRKSARNKKNKKNILNDEDSIISSSEKNLILNDEDSLISISEKNHKVSKHDDLHVKDKTSENDIQKEIPLSLLSNKEAFQILESEFARINLNILDVLKHDKLQTLLNSSESLDNEMYVLFNSFKQNYQKPVPVVHLVRSRKTLIGIIKKLQKSM